MVRQALKLSLRFRALAESRVFLIVIIQMVKRTIDIFAVLLAKIY